MQIDSMKEQVLTDSDSMNGQLFTDIDSIKGQVLTDIDPELKVRKKKAKKKARMITFLEFAAIVVIILVVFRLCFGVATVQGDSMYPSLHDGNHVFYQRIFHQYEAGDVVVVKRPNQETYVKRVVAAAGDSVNLEGGHLFVNGKEIVFDGEYGDTYAAKNEISYPYTVGQEQVFVLGDNREHSEDSRTFGAVDLNDIGGRLLFYIGTL